MTVIYYCCSDLLCYSQARLPLIIQLYAKRPDVHCASGRSEAMQDFYFEIHLYCER